MHLLTDILRKFIDIFFAFIQCSTLDIITLMFSLQVHAFFAMFSFLQIVWHGVWWGPHSHKFWYHNPYYRPEVPSILPGTGPYVTGNGRWSIGLCSEGFRQSMAPPKAFLLATFTRAVVVSSLSHSCMPLKRRPLCCTAALLQSIIVILDHLDLIPQGSDGGITIR